MTDKNRQSSNYVSNDRYSRQVAFSGIGKAGQERLARSLAVVVGAGALGSVTSDNLVRAGVGTVRIIDRDYVELSNLQRQVLYTEQDAAEQKPKAIAAADHLREINSEVNIEPINADLNSSNVDELISDADIVVDASDNLEVRLLLNEACHHYGIPWVYGGAIRSSGMTMNFTWRDDAPCFRCLIGDENEGTHETCATAGVLHSITSVIASIQAAEAVKILTGSDSVREELLYIDIWNNQVQTQEVCRDPGCPVCGGRSKAGKQSGTRYDAGEQSGNRYDAAGDSDSGYTHYGKSSDTRIISLCGRNSIQVIPPGKHLIDLKELACRLAPLCRSESELAGEEDMSYSEPKIGLYTLDFTINGIEWKVFPDGRAVIKGTTDKNKAKALYAEYIGL